MDNPESSTLKPEFVEGSFTVHSPEANNIYLPVSEEGIKHDDGKLRMDLVPQGALFELAKVYTYGAKKYGDNNWRKGLKWGRVLAAIMRHLGKWAMGEERDKESGLLHLAHAAWGCFTLIEYAFSHPQLDDRIKTPERVDF